MANCGLSTGYSFTCEDKKAGVGGLRNRVFLFNANDLQSVVFNSTTNYVEDLVFTTYGGLYEFSGLRLGNTLVDDVSRTDNGNAFYPQTLELQIVDVTPAQRLFLEEIANAEGIGYVIEYPRGSADDINKGRFEIGGYNFGLELESASRDSGAPDTDSNRIVTLTGNEPNPPRIFYDGTSYETTLALLTSYIL